MNRNFDFNAIKEYQDQMVGMINQQISAMNSEKSKLESEKTNLESRVAALGRAHASHANDRDFSCNCESQITLMTNRIRVISTRVSDLNRNIADLATAITDTNAFITSLRERITATDVTFSQKIETLNNEISAFIARMDSIGNLIGTGAKMVVSSRNNSGVGLAYNYTSITFGDVLSNITKGSFEHFVGASMINNINSRFAGHPDAESLKTSTLNGLGIKDVTDAGQMLAWAQTLGLLDVAQFTTGVTAGQYAHLGIPIDYMSGYLNENVVDAEHTHAVNLANNMTAIYGLPSQHPIPTATTDWNNWQDYNAYSDIPQSVLNDPNSYQSETGAKYVHTGTDFAARLQPVYAVTGGTVVRIRRDIPHGGASEGNYAYIRDENGNIHHYAHLNSPEDKLNKVVIPGEKIGTSGNSGNGGYHLHYEVQNSAGQWSDAMNDINPYNYLPVADEEES